MTTEPILNETLLTCKCNNCETNICHAKIACYQAFRNNQYHYGCFNQILQTIQCNQDKISIECCKYDYCNLDKSVLFHNSHLKTDQNSIYSQLTYLHNIAFFVSTLLCVLVIVSSLFVYFYCTKLKKKTNHDTIKADKPMPLTPHTATTTSTKSTHFPGNYDLSVATSGSSQVELVQRTLARDLRIDYTSSIGQGRYGVVWKAKWNDEIVAVKSFFSMHEASWLREIDIYQTCMLRHENILGFIAADIKGTDSCVNMLLVTEYHSIGSLYDYLQTNTVDYKTLIKYAYNIVNGLNHLHMEILSNKYKPSIAHRDIKSRNILIKSTNECCIADFGLAVRYNSQLNKLDVATSRLREGSHLFMAPECLNETLNLSSIDEFKRADIYSYALVLWELLKRYSDAAQGVEEYQPPFYEYTSTEPTLDQMKDIVCVKQQRPQIAEAKLNKSSLKPFISLIHECWQNKPTGRLQALRIKKNLRKLLEQTIHADF